LMMQAESEGDSEMGKHVEFAKTVVKKYLDRHFPRDRSFAKAKTRVCKAICEYEERIDEIVDRFEGDPPDKWKEHIGSLTQRIGEERDFLKEIEELEATDWAK
jgi:hypothetical protein